MPTLLGRLKVTMTQCCVFLVGSSLNPKLKHFLVYNIVPFYLYTMLKTFFVKNAISSLLPLLLKCFIRRGNNDITILMILLAVLFRCLVFKFKLYFLLIITNINMPRKYAPKPGIKSWLHNYPQLQDAIEANESGDMTLTESSKAFKIPQTTLHDKYNSK